MHSTDTPLMDALDNLLIEHRLGAITGETLIATSQGVGVLTIAHVERAVIARRIGQTDQILAAMEPFTALLAALKRGEVSTKSEDASPVAVLINDDAGNAMFTTSDLKQILEAQPRRATISPLMPGPCSSIDRNHARQHQSDTQ